MKKLIVIFTIFATFLVAAFGKTVYVNANYPTDGNGTSWSSPYTNLQTAVTASIAGDLILVTNGVYAPITTGNKAITIQSVNGYADTIIDGGGTTRCATLGTGVVLDGFTTRNGASTDGGGTYGGSVLNSVIENCTASNMGGGASGGTLTGCTISGNTSGTYGGGASVSTLTGCTISGNTANQRGGGTYVGTLIGCTISGNTALINGGGCYNGTIMSCLVVGNIAPVGSQIRNQDSNFYAYNSTIIGECSFPNTTRDIFNNIFYGANITFPITAQVGFNTFSGTLTGGTIVGPNLTATNPQFVDAANGDFTLLPTSPCINKGANQYVTTPTDLAGNPRIANGVVDMGAYESQSTRFSTTPNALYPMGRKDVK